MYSIGYLLTYNNYFYFIPQCSQYENANDANFGSLEMAPML